MSANTRRAELMRLLLLRRQDTVPNLAAELGVSEKTIRRDLAELTVHYPLITVHGNGGGVRVEAWYRPRWRRFTAEECAVLRELLPSVNSYQRSVVIGLLNTYGAPVE